MFDEKGAPRLSIVESSQHLDYFTGTLYEAFARTAQAYPDFCAYEYMGAKTRYREMRKRVDLLANALTALGVQPEQRVSIALPNIPQAVEIFYAVNRIGAIANMVHPLSAENEISFYLCDSESVVLIALDQFAEKFISAAKKAGCVKHMIITGPEDMLPAWKKLVYRCAKKRTGPKTFEGCLSYQALLALSGKAEAKTARAKMDHAVILYSGGTTGASKGIMASNAGFNAVAQQVYSTNTMFTPGDKMLAVLPMFHGFGLGVCIHAMMFNGGTCILVPRFTLKTYAALLKRHRPNFIAGVPTLYEALIMLESVRKMNLSYLKGVYCGGDSLGIELKKRIDAFLFEHKSAVPIREGYGLTECICVACLTPADEHKEGAIGTPVPDVCVKIVKPSTEEAVPVGEEGEICISGPTVMLEYVKQPEETRETVRTHADGREWLHTGDLGRVDEDGYVYFIQRLKRMIVTSGYNVYPSQIEAILDKHPMVHKSCIIGVNDPYKIKRIKAFIVLKSGVPASASTEAELLEYLKKNIARYAMPKQIEFRSELPQTKLSKVDYRALEEEENAK